MTTEETWNARAEIWEAVEHFGLQLSDLEVLDSPIPPPVLVVGAGQGVLMEGLLKRGNVVAGVDSSQRMIERAKERRGLHIEHGVAESLPFGDNQFASAIVVTGVLHPCEVSRNGRCLAECFRVVAPNGNVVLAFQCLSRRLRRVAQELGYVCGSVQDHDRVVALWKVYPELVRCARLISKWTDQPFANALEVATENRWALDGISRCLDEVMRLLQYRGNHADRFISENDLFGYEFFTETQVLEAVGSSDYEFLSIHRSSQKVVIAVLSCG